MDEMNLFDEAIVKLTGSELVVSASSSKGNQKKWKQGDCLRR